MNPQQPQMPPPPPYQVAPQKSSGGCLPFLLGCFSGCFFMLVVIVGLGVGAVYLGGQFINKYASSVYFKEVRPEIEQSNLTPAQKKVLLTELDRLAQEFPDMTLAEKKQAMQDLMKTLETLQVDPTLLEGLPHDQPAQP